MDESLNTDPLSWDVAEYWADLKARTDKSEGFTRVRLLTYRIMFDPKKADPSMMNNVARFESSLFADILQVTHRDRPIRLCAVRQDLKPKSAGVACHSTCTYWLLSEMQAFKWVRIHWQALAETFKATDAQEATSQIRIKNTSQKDQSVEIEYRAPQACDGPSPSVLADEISKQVRPSHMGRLILAGACNSLQCD